MSVFTNNRLLPVITLLLLTANIVTLGYLWTHRSNTMRNDRPQHPPAGPVFEFITKELQLDASQQRVYKLLREEHQAGQQPLQDSIRKAKDALFELLKLQTVSDSLLQVQSTKAAGAEQQLDLYTFKHFQKLRAICTAAQQEKFDKMIKDVLQLMAQGRRPKGPPPGEGEGPDGMPPPPKGKTPPVE